MFVYFLPPLLERTVSSCTSDNSLNLLGYLYIQNFEPNLNERQSAAPLLSFNSASTNSSTCFRQRHAPSPVFTF